MKITTTIAASVAALALFSTASLGADLVRKAPPKPVVAAAPPCDLAFGGGVQSDYNFRGISQTDKGVGGFAYVEPRCKVHPNIELYAGIWAWSTKLPTTPTAEVDVYGGIRPTIGPVAFDFGFMYYWYPKEVQQWFNNAALTSLTTTPTVFGPFTVRDTDFWEFYGKATWTVNDWLSLSPYVYYTPNWLGTGAKATYAGGTVKVTAPSAWFPSDVGMYASADVARYWIGTFNAFGVPFDLPDYTQWNAGIGFTYKVVTLDIRYYDTDLSRAACFLLTSDPSGVTSGTNTSKWCDATVIAKLSFDLTLNNNIK